jgi:hypothetical protein
MKKRTDMDFCIAVAESNLDGQSKAILQYARRWFQKDGQAELRESQETLARHTGFSVKTIERRLPKLEELGWLTRIGEIQGPNGGKPIIMYSLEIPVTVTQSGVTVTQSGVTVTQSGVTVSETDNSTYTLDESINDSTDDGQLDVSDNEMIGEAGALAERAPTLSDSSEGNISLDRHVKGLSPSESSVTVTETVTSKHNRESCRRRICRECADLSDVGKDW